MEDDEFINESIYTAIRLLHSTEADSVDRLRALFDLAVSGELCGNVKREDGSGIVRDSIVDGDEPNTLKIEKYPNATDSMDNIDIPRISIPDEASSDNAVCKVCSCERLGPMILLECQDCQQFYHPLCHQPPIADIDVYDPRIVWRCSDCSMK